MGYHSPWASVSPCINRGCCHIRFLKLCIERIGEKEKLRLPCSLAKELPAGSVSQGQGGGQKERGNRTTTTG